MKICKYIFFIFFIFITYSCSRFGQGGKNAEQYVSERLFYMRENIDNIEAIEEDSLLSDIGLIFDMVNFAKAGLDFTEEKINKKEYEKIIDKREQLLIDIENSWRYSIIINDSLRRLDKFDTMWRKVYKVCITMKNGITKETRVMMDNDGKTPRMLESDMIKKLEEYYGEIYEARDKIIFLE